MDKKAAFICLLFTLTCNAQNLIGFNYSLVKDQTYGFGISQTLLNSRICFINNAGIAFVKNYKSCFDNDNKIHGFYLNSIFYHDFLKTNVTISPYCSYLVYGLFNFDKRVDMSFGLQCNAYNRFALSCGLVKPVNPHVFVPWTFYETTYSISASVFVYKFGKG